MKNFTDGSGVHKYISVIASFFKIDFFFFFWPVEKWFIRKCLSNSAERDILKAVEWKGVGELTGVWVEEKKILHLART